MPPGGDRVEARRGRHLRIPLVVALLTGCAADPDTPPVVDGPVSFIDAAGSEHVFDEPARRIVSLVPSATETLLAIGADDVLIGRTDFDSGDWLEDVPSVGGGLEPNMEALVALRPDVVIRFAGEQDPRTPARLDELGIRHVAVRPASLADIYATNSIIGEVTGHTEAAESLSAVIRSGLAELETASRALPTLRFAYVLGGSPPWVAGPNTYIEEILVLLGGENAFADLEAPYAAVSPEELRTRQIDVVLVSARGQYDEELTPGARIETVGDVLESPGPGVVEAARAVATAMHGRSLR